MIGCLTGESSEKKKVQIESMSIITRTFIEIGKQSA